MHHVYILYSDRANLNYIGNTDLDPNARLEQHNSGLHPKAATKRGIPWRIILIIPCSSRTQARGIEAHIKRMKSKVYVENLIRYPEMREKLLKKYKA